MVQRLVQTGRACPANLKTVVYGGGPMYVDSLKKAMAAFGPIFVQLYGQGEAPMTITGVQFRSPGFDPVCRRAAVAATPQVLCGQWRFASANARPVWRR